MRVTRTATRLLVAALCCVLNFAATSAQTPAATNNQTIERTVHVAPPGAGASRYFYVPFDVPRGASRIRVAYDYAREGGANTIDLGVFDSRFGGTDTDPRGFRGWSGGRRAEFSISRAEATPGYLAGALPAGRWRVILGLYKVAPAGVDVKLKINIETGGSSAGLRAPAGLAAAQEELAGRRSHGARLGWQVTGTGLRWFSGDLHTHTVHSDGDWTISGLVKAAFYADLDFLFVTDHNTASHHAEVARAGLLSPELLVMRGEEVTTYGGHANAWGLPAGAVLDFRVRPGDAAAIRRVAARAHRLGALISINHPFALCGGCSWSYKEALQDFDAIEVWNGEWDATDESALKLWDGLLQRGLRPTAVASSDTHREQNPVGRPTTHVAAATLTQAALLEGIRRGRVYLTEKAAGLPVEFEVAAGRIGSAIPLSSRSGPGEVIQLRAPATLVFFIKVNGSPLGATLSLVSGGQVVHTEGTQERFTEVFEVECRADSYYRLEVRNRDGKMLALTNPVYVTVGRARELKGVRARGGRVSSRPRRASPRAESEAEASAR